MVNIKYAFQGLSKKWVFTLLTIVQFVACIVFLYIGLSTSNFIKIQTQRVEGIFNNKVIYSLKKNDAKIDSDYSNEQLKNFDQYLEDNKNFKSIHYQSSGLYTQKFKESSSFLRKTGNKNIDEKVINNKDFSYVHCAEINKSFAEEFPLRLQSGRFFSSADFSVAKSKAIPVVLGSSYSKIFKLGSELDYINLDESGTNIAKLKVIGFLDKDVYFTSIFNFSIEGNMDDLSNYIIFPKRAGKNNLFFNIVNNLIVVNSNAGINRASLEKGIIDKGTQNGFDISLVSAQEGIANLQNENKTNENLINFAAVVILIFSIASLLTIMLQTIIRRFKEFGIHIMQGAAMTDIAKRIFYEILIIVAASYSISLSIVINLFRKVNMLAFSWTVFKQLTLILIILTIGISIVPIIKILRFQVDKLVRGNE